MLTQMSWSKLIVCKWHTDNDNDGNSSNKRASKWRTFNVFVCHVHCTYSYFHISFFTFSPTHSHAVSVSPFDLQMFVCYFVFHSFIKLHFFTPTFKVILKFIVNGFMCAFEYKWVRLCVAIIRTYTIDSRPKAEKCSNVKMHQPHWFGDLI